ncbi:helix-turn-helix domain-containing protein [Enterobacteriaceae bacterium G50]|nr:helix-turn-helix domain-containing protein [Enterobacteriaceae bacterium G50]
MKMRHTPTLNKRHAEEMVNTFMLALQAIPLMGESCNERDYLKALELIEFLVDRDQIDNPLFELLSSKIHEYEQHAPEFSHLNKVLNNTPTGVAMLRTLMDQNGLKPADLANELGSKSNISNILNGRRALTVRHIKALSERFKLPAESFID